jgi:peptidoglycan/LPS O-acetylase OafA/YrhL
MASVSGEKHIYGLDAIRFLSAVFVSVFHFTWRNSEAAAMMPFGWIGVQIFFVISGVVIASSATDTTPKRFIMGRALRLYPAAWLAAALNAIVLILLPVSVYQSMGISVSPQIGALARSLTLVGGTALASAYWTLPIEISFYAVIFIVLLVGGRTRLKAIAKVLVLLSFPYLAALLLRQSHLINWPWLDLGYGMKNMLLVRHGPFFALGIFIWTTTQGISIKNSDFVTISISTAHAGVEI